MREEVPAALDGQRLDRVVAMVTGLTRGAVAELVASGAVRVNGVEATKAGRKLVEGDVVEAEVPGAVAPAELAPSPVWVPAPSIEARSRTDAVK